MLQGLSLNGKNASTNARRRALSLIVDYRLSALSFHDEHDKMLSSLCTNQENAHIDPTKRVAERERPDDDEHS